MTPVPPAGGELADACCQQLQNSWDAGHRLPVEYFVLQNPRLAEHPEALLELLLLEISLREEAGEAVAPAELVRRFPDLAAPLQLHLALRDKFRGAAREPAGAGGPAGGGFTIHGYEVGREIGRGGMATVYAARQLSLNRAVALKMLSAGGRAGSQLLARFTTEAEAVARLQHPNVVQIFEVGLHDGQPFLALELAEGGTLADRVRTGPLAAAEAAGLVATLARAAHAAHERGIVHRDLKPANVLFTPPPGGGPAVPKLTDFGLAKLLDRTDHQTRTGDTLGTPGYMAPEQVTGSGRVGPAADVYGLGAILYECLTGHPPFRGATAAEVLLHVTQAEPLPPGRVRPGLPRDIQTVCLKCLEKNPRRRYPSAGAVADDLERFCRGEPVRARPVGPVGRLVKRVRRHPLLSGLLAGLVVAIAAGLAGVTWKWREAADLAGREASQRASAEVNLYRTRVAQAALLWQSNNLAGAKEHLGLCRPAPGRPDLRGWEWNYLDRLFNPEEVTLRHRYWVRGVAVSPDGREVAVACGEPEMAKLPSQGELVVWDLAARTPLWRLTGEEVGSVAYSPDGRYLACGTVAGATRVFDRATRRELFAWPGVRGITVVAFHPDGRHLATLSDQPGGRIVVRDLATGAEAAARPQEHHQDWCPIPAFTPDGRRLFFVGQGNMLRFWDWHGGGDERIPTNEREVHAIALTRAGLPVTAGLNGAVVWNRATGQPLRRLTIPAGVTCALASSPSGELVATGGSDQTVRVWDAATAAELRTLRGHTWTVRGLAFTPDGKRLVSGGQDTLVKVWDVTRNPRGQLLAGKGWVNAVAFTPGGGVRASYHGDRVRDWLVPSGQAAAEMPIPDSRQKLEWPRCLADFSPDGRLLLSASEADPRVPKVWDVDTGAPVAAYAGHTLTVQAVGFSPDGRWAASAAWDNRAEPGDCEVRVWDARTGAERTGFTVPQSQVMSVAISPDGGRLAVGCGAAVAPGRSGLVLLWNLTTGTKYAQIAQHQGKVTAVAFSPDGRRVASVGKQDETLCLIDAADGRILNTATAVRSPTGLAYSPDGRRLAVIGYESVVSIRDSDDGTEVFRIPGLVGVPEYDIASDARVRFSPGGEWLVSTNWDGNLNLWDGRPRDRLPEVVADIGP